MPWIPCFKCNGNDVWRKCPTCNGRTTIGRDRFGNDVPCTMPGCTGGEVITPCPECNGMAELFVKD